VVSSTAPASPRRSTALAQASSSTSPVVSSCEAGDPLGRVVRLDGATGADRIQQRRRQPGGRRERGVRVPLEVRAVVRGHLERRELADPLGQHAAVPQRRTHRLQGSAGTRGAQHRVERTSEAPVRLEPHPAGRVGERVVHGTLVGGILTRRSAGSP
jgi:hypothetical protein